MLNINRVRPSFAIAVVALAGISAPVYAASETSTIAASATVSTVCSISTGGLSFGTLTTSSAKDATASVTANCTNGGTYSVGLNDGVNAEAGQRRLASGGGQYLNYELFKESGYTARWGSSGEDAVDGIGVGSAQTLTVYGRIAGGQTLHSGNGTLNYGDTVTVTITY